MEEEGISQREIGTRTLKAQNKSKQTKPD